MLTDKEIISLYMWDTDTNEEKLVVTELEYVIRNPGGFRLEQVGLALLNRERRKIGLTQYAINLETGTYDEIC